MRDFRTYVFAIVMAVCSAPSQAAEVKVFSDGPLQAGLARIVSAFAERTGHIVQMVYGTAPALRSKLAAGEKTDVLITLGPEIDEMDHSGKLAAVQKSVASVKLGLAVRRGAPAPEIGTVEALKSALLQADSILHNDLASGRAFAAQLERIGIAEQVRAKIVVVRGNGQLDELARRTGKDLAGGPLTQIAAAPAVQLVGVLPADAQQETVYSAGIMKDAQSEEAARAFLAFLGSELAANAFRETGAR